MPPESPMTTLLHFEFCTYVLIKSLMMVETSSASIERFIISPQAHVLIDSFNIFPALWTTLSSTEENMERAIAIGIRRM